ncbi:alpha/beta hydrolase, partial [Mitsuaria sp. TWR114]
MSSSSSRSLRSCASAALGAFAALGVTVALTAAGPALAKDAAPAGAKPTIVLVHGAFA